MWVKYARSGPSRETTLERFGHVEMRRMRAFAQRIEDDDANAFEQGPRRVGDAAAVGQVREWPDAESQHRQLAVKERDRDDLDAAHRERSGDREQPQLRDAAAQLPRPRENVLEHPAEIGLGLRAGIAADRLPPQRG